MLGIKKAGGISFGVSMVTSQLGRDTKTARGIVGGFVDDTKKRLAGLRSSFSAVGTSLAAAFSVGAITTFAKRQFDMIDALHDTAKNLGITTEGLSRLGFAAEQSGSSQEVVEKSIAKMVKSTRDASLGLETYSRAYDKLGLSAAALNKLAPEKQFAEIAEAIKNLKNENDQLTVAQDIFGRGGKELVETLRLGKDGLSAMADEADRVGATINSFDAAKVAEAADELNKLKKELAGIGNQLAVDLGPAAVGIAQRVATGISRMTGGEGGENVAEKQLRQKTELMLVRGEGLRIAAQQRFEAKQRAKALQNPLNLPTHAEYLQRKKQQTASEVVGGLAASAKEALGFGKNLLNTPQQILDGIVNGPAAQAQRQLFAGEIQRVLGGGNISQGVAQPGSPAKYKTLGSFDAVESGSVAAYQQRIRGAQQFNKVQDKQLAAQERMAALLDSIDSKTVEWGKV